MRIAFVAIILLCFFSVSVFAQNTKGDKPATQRTGFRLPKLLKGKSKGGDKPFKGDVSGRRIRTKNSSSAGRANQIQRPARVNRTPSGDHAYKPRGGQKLRIKSRTREASRNNVFPNHGEFVNKRSGTAAAARNNVFPNHGEFVHNPSRKPRDNQRAYSNGRALSRAASLGTKRRPPASKKVISPRSASRSYVTRGRKNVYWGKFKVKERPVTTDITGRTLRAKNFHTPGLGVIPAGDVYKRRTKKRGDQPYKGTFTSGYVTTPKTTRAWRGDVSGHAIRTRPPKVSQTAGQMFEPRKLSASNRRRGLNSPLPGSSLGFHPKSRISNRPLPSRAPGFSMNLIARAMGKLKGRKTFKGGGSVHNRFNNNGQPINVKGPGIGGRFVDRYQGNLKAQRTLKGGGSVSGRGWNNAGRPINVKGPGIGGRYVDTYRGFSRGGLKKFSIAGYGYAGSTKSQRAPHGGGSISGQARNNRGQPIQVKGPGIGGRYADIYQGNIKAQRQAKGGGSISGKLWNNAGQPINVRAPKGIQAKYVDIYQGFLKGRKAFNTDGSDYKGNIKFFREPKGGGSVSGKLWNNNGKAIRGREPHSIQAKYVDIYQGFYKAQKPLKGGGSVSGKLWNNNEKPINGKTYSPSSLKVAVFAGDKKQSHYVLNPNQKKAALKKVKPDKTTYLVGNLQVKTKAKDYERNEHAAKNAMKGNSAGKNSLRAIEYSSKIKVLWTKAFGPEKAFAGRQPMKKYVHNPNSKKGALLVMAPGKANARIQDLQVNVKMLKPHGNNMHPDSKFAHSFRNNVKQERTFLMNLKLKWAKLFKKNDTQPAAVKTKVRRPRYDPKERDLWKDLYD